MYAENDQLKLQQLADRKKIDLLLSLSGITEDEVTFFLSEAAKKSSIIPQRLNKKTVTKLDSKRHSHKDTVEVDRSQGDLECNDVDILKLKVC